MKSLKTTALGIFALLTALGAAGTALLDGNPETSLDIGSVIGAFAGLGLIFARDHNVSSEDAGIK